MLQKRIRITLDLAPEVDALLDNLAQRIHGTKADVLRKGLTIMEVAVEAKEKGRRFGVTDDPEKLITEIVGV